MELGPNMLMGRCEWVLLRSENRDQFNEAQVHTTQGPF